MARFYHVDIARFAADADEKWVDNLLSHYDVPGVEVPSRDSPAAYRPSASTTSRSFAPSPGTPELARRAAVSLSARLLTPAYPRVSIVLVWTSRFDRDAFERQIDRHDQRSRGVDCSGAPRPPAKERYRQRRSTRRRRRGRRAASQGNGGTRWVPLADAEQPARELPSDLAHILRGRSLLTLDEVELDWLALGERLEAVA